MGSRAVFLTFCTSGRARHFASPAIVDMVSEQILRTAAEERVVIAVYCYMPDHVHLLAESGFEENDVTRFVKLAKQRSAYHAKQRFAIRLWQPSYYDHVLREHEATQGVVRYILENPVRAGLASSVSDYPFTGSSKWTIDELMSSLEVPCWVPPRDDDCRPEGLRYAPSRC
jgi:REP-associated tyrosine transposase